MIGYGDLSKNETGTEIFKKISTVQPTWRINWIIPSDGQTEDVLSTDVYYSLYTITDFMILFEVHMKSDKQHMSVTTRLLICAISKTLTT